MTPIEKFKELLGEEANNLSEKDIYRLREVQYGLTEIIFDK